jgi:hypothetical protein
MGVVVSRAGARVVPLWDRPWLVPDHVRLDYVDVSARVLVLSSSWDRVQFDGHGNSVFDHRVSVLVVVGSNVGWLHSDEVAIENPPGCSG